MTMKPCATCGEPTNGTRCDEHQREHRRKTERPKDSTTKRAYGRRWRKLSLRARAAQPFCLACGSTTDLQCDHTPEAWRRWEAGLPVRLQDVQVLCGPCNRAAGAARGNNVTRADRGGERYPQGRGGPDAKAQGSSHTPGGYAGQRKEAP